MKFKREWLMDTNGDENDVVNTINGSTRWSIDYDRVFKFEQKFYSAPYSVGATESQDEAPYEFDDDMVECGEVFPHEEIKIVYKTTP